MSTRIAMVITARNERALIRQNVCYHHFFGVEKVYVYLDQCVDGTEEALRGLPFVSVHDTREADTYENDHDAAVYLSGLRTMVTARQCLNALDAIRAARAEGMEWICHVDADELLSVDPKRVERGILAEFFDGLPPDVDAVRFRTYATCREHMSCGDRFADIDLFTTPYTFVERRLEWPDGRGHFRHSLLMGHRLGKMAARVREDTLPDGVHRFKRRANARQRTFSFPLGFDGCTRAALAQPGNVRAFFHPRPRLLHYYLTDVRDFASKFRRHKDHPNRYMNGKEIEDVFRRWRDFVNAPATSEEELRRYYENNVLDRFSQGERRRLLLTKQLAHIGAPRRFFREVYPVVYAIAGQAK